MNGKRSEGLWSSLPVLVLWMIKDKLAIFDNHRLAAVCRDWRSASARYPRTLDSVGDGVPWIWRADISRNWSVDTSRKWEFISFFLERKFVIDRAEEFVEADVLSSKQGWLLSRNWIDNDFRGPSLLFFMNIFTGVKVELPHLGISQQYDASFTTYDGNPRRVFVVGGGMDTWTINTACVGDQVWTCHTYSKPKRQFPGEYTLISIGERVYFQEADSTVTVFDAASQSFKELGRLGESGFIAELGGELIYIEREFSREQDPYTTQDSDCYYIDYDYSSFAVHRHNDDSPGSWKKLDKSELMGTSWFLCEHHGCITAKGSGLKVYQLCRVRGWKNPLARTSLIVVVYDLMTGTVEVNRLPHGSQDRLKWVAIG